MSSAFKCQSRNINPICLDLQEFTVTIYSRVFANFLTVQVPESSSNSGPRRNRLIKVDPERTCIAYKQVAFHGNYGPQFSFLLSRLEFLSSKICLILCKDYLFLFDLKEQSSLLKSTTMTIKNRHTTPPEHKPTTAQFHRAAKHNNLLSMTCFPS